MNILKTIYQTIIDKKGKNSILIDVRGVTDFTDYFIIAEGSVDRHIQAICREIGTVLEKKGITPTCVEGEHGGEWIVMDYAAVVVHLFTHETRMKYALEEVWKDGVLVNV